MFSLSHATHPIDSSAKEVQQSIRDYGFAIIKNFLSKNDLVCLIEDLEPLFTARSTSDGPFWGQKTTRIESLLFSKVMQQVVLRRSLMDLVDFVLKDNCDQVQLNLTQGIRIHPGEKNQILHRDSSMYPVTKTCDFMVNSIIALTPFTRNNGATRIVPGSHLWADSRLPEPQEIISAEMNPGDMIFYNSSLLHGGGANTTESHRTGVAISYSLGWLRQSENMYLTYPPEKAEAFSLELRQLIGYEVHRPNLGWVFGQSPMRLIDKMYNSQQGASEFLTPEQQQKLRSLK
jgi:ectoine hydroxylase-related dioxygenase (phytanoyl-CoA dioxygenase family)